ncbi:MAG: tetratricopeptide repeat protein [Desulfobacteraceae bacterium]|jgi:tetratricopeptide (TPR) repeat protein
MSYINEALKKAQKDKDASNMGYIRSIGKPGSMERSFDKKYIYLFLIIFLLVVLLIYSKFGKQTEQGPDIGRGTISDAPEVIHKKKNNILAVTDNQLQSAEDVTEKEIREKEVLRHREALYTQATSFLKEGKLEKAENIFKEILVQDPGHIRSLNNMGVLSLNEEKYEDAIYFFEKAVKLKPKFANPYYNLACTYSLQNNGDKGMAYLLKAIEIDKNVKNWAKEDPDLENLKEYAEFTVITD